MLLLEYRDGKLVREFELRLKKDVITLGRWSDCDYQICPDMQYMSKVQCTLERRGDNWLLHDGQIDPPKRSANGIYQEGRRIEEPLLMLPGTKADIFRRHIPELPGQDDWIELHYRDVAAIVSPAHQATYTGGDNEQVIELINLLRSDVGASSDRIGKHDAFLEQIVQQLRSLEEERAKERALNARQSRLLARHDKLITRVGLSMAACVVGLSIWHLSNGNESTVEKGLNLFMVLMGGGGGALLWQKDGEAGSSSE